MPLAAGQQLGDNLVLERELGSGGMGTVWLAQNRALGSHVAVKVLRASGDAVEVARQRFEQEARGVAQIDHPHVVKVFDYGMTAAGEPYLVMELLRGEDLSQRIERLGRLSLAETVTVIGQACKALGRAHEQGIVHRDIKPANLFLMDVDGEPFVKVLDFGIAKYRRAADMAMTETGAVMGTPYFMSPEQIIDAKEIDHRCDLWALGVVTYCCLVGDVPFHGQSVGALSIAIHQGAFAPVRRVRPELPETVDAWLARALATRPEQRFQSARELGEALASASQGFASGAVAAGTAPPAWQGGGAVTPWQASQAGQASGALAHADTYLAPAAAAAAHSAGAFATPQPTWGTQPGVGPAAPMAPAPQAPAARSSAWIWLLAGIGLAALLAVGLAAGWYFLRDDGREVASRERKRSRHADERADDGNSGVADPTSSASAAPAPPKSKGNWPVGTNPGTPANTGPPPADSVEPKPTRNLGAGKAAVAGCWLDNEGAAGAGTAASSVTITVHFSPRGTVAGVIVGGPASAHTHFRSCAVSRLSSTQFGPGDGASASWSQSLPASRPKK